MPEFDPNALGRAAREAVASAYEGGPPRGTPEAPDSLNGGGSEHLGSGPPAGYDRTEAPPTDGQDDSDEQAAEGNDEDEGPDQGDADDTDEGPQLRSGADVAAWVLSQPGGVVELEDGSTMSGRDYLAALADCTPAEWQAFCDENGWDPALRPAESDWPRDMQSERIADRLDARLAAIRRGEAPYI